MWTRHLLALAFSLLSSAPAVIAAQAAAQRDTLSSSLLAPALLHPQAPLHGGVAMQHPFTQTQGETAAPARAPQRPRPRPRLRVGSLNIRYDVHSRHPLLKPATDLFRLHSRTWGEQRWDRRRDQLVDQVLFHELDLVGFQEVLHHQLGDLAQLLGDEEEGWSHVGVGRDDGKHAGEAVPIFYRKSRLELVSVSHRWLSPTPSEPGSKGWDAGQPRMVTFAHFRDLDLLDEESSLKNARTDLIVANTHWDDRGLLAREKSAELILDLVAEQVDEALARERAPVSSDEQQSADDAGQQEPLVVLLGDLNSPAEEAGYQVLTGRRYFGASSDLGAGASSPQSTSTTDSPPPRSFFDARHELVVRRSCNRGSSAAADAATEFESRAAESSSTAPAGGAMSRRYGPLNTYTGFEPSDVSKVIDFILPYANSAFSPAPARLDTTTTASRGSSESRKWSVTRYGVVQNFFEDVGGRRGASEEEKNDAMILSDHRLVVVGFERQ